jgi:hypothetical protein
MLLVNDARKLPEIYHRTANKTEHYNLGLFEKVVPVVLMKDHKLHARHRKLIAGPVRVARHDGAKRC